MSLKKKSSVKLIRFKSIFVADTKIIGCEDIGSLLGKKVFYEKWLLMDAFK